MKRLLPSWPCYDRRGVAAIEFALLGGILIAMCVATIEIGLLFWGQSALEAAAAQTARCLAVQSPQCPSAGTYAANVVSKWMFTGVVSAGDVTANGAATSCNGSSGNFETVTITSSYFATWLPSFVPQFANRSLSASACYPKSS